MTSQGATLEEIPAVGGVRADALRAAGYDTVDAIADASDGELASVDEIDEWLAPCLQQGAKELRGDLDTVFVALAAETHATREEVFAAFGEFAYQMGSFESKRAALRAAFGEAETSVFALGRFAVGTLYPFYHGGYHRLSDVAETPVEELTDLRYTDPETAREVWEAARAASGKSGGVEERRTESGTDTGTEDDESPREAAANGGAGESDGTAGTGEGDEGASDTRGTTETDDERERPPTDVDHASRDEALALLRESVGPDAEFRPQQWAAIDRLVNERGRLLLVQRTGWGKSSVYFVATRLLRARGAGPTLIISPLLALMRNQIADAQAELGLEAVTINSNNDADWTAAKEAVVEGTCDLLLISPERLANREFQRDVLAEMEQAFGMLVVDEAHCISDWGHDFRPDYRRIKDIIERLDPDIPVAATTATANDRVVEDITTQLPELRPFRGSLMRESLRIQAMDLGERERRLAWLAENLTGGENAGVVYCLTVQDVEMVASWLGKQGLTVLPYHGGLDGDVRRERERLLMENEVDALVATNALGMGFNKPDLGFVVHFQRPPNLIQYYQEIGRAGRQLEEAHAILLSGEGDDDIAEYFIESAFPTSEQFDAVLAAVEANPNEVHGWNVSQHSGVGGKAARKCLKILEVEGAIARRDGGFVRTGEWTYDAERFEGVTEQRWRELDRIQEFVETDDCLMRFIDDELDGEMEGDCGRCANCAGEIRPSSVQDEDLVHAAIEHYRAEGRGTIDPRIMTYTDDGSRTKMDASIRPEPGRVLSVWDDPGWGERVKHGKEEAQRFDDELVAASADLVTEVWVPDPMPAWVTAVPSASNPGLVRGFAERLAETLGLPFVPAVEQVDEKAPQREMGGSVQQCRNVRGAFGVTGALPDGPVLLVDDVVASRWTLTEVSTVLREAGSGSVYPFALAER